VRSAYLRPDSWQLFDDALPCLQALRSTGWRHVILSNHVPELPDIIESLGLAPFIDKVFNSAQTGFEKPHADAFAMVLSSIDNATRENANRIWMIGDSVTADIAGAQAAGLRTVLVRSQHPSADHCCQTLAEIPALLNRF
jgi:putative hydrolase of the HAD superfamily